MERPPPLSAPRQSGDAHFIRPLLAQSGSEIRHSASQTIKPITATTEGGLLERMPHFHSAGGIIFLTSFSTSNKKPLTAFAGGALNSPR
jgi:hypothetical protein